MATNNDVIKAFLAGENKRAGNLYSFKTSRYMILQFFGNDIARLEDGKLSVCTDYTTVSTIRNLNKLPRVKLKTTNGVTRLNGVTVNGTWMDVL